MLKLNLKTTIVGLILLFIIFGGFNYYYTGKFSFWQNHKRTLTNPLLRYIKFKEVPPLRHKLIELIEKEKSAGHAEEIAVYFRTLTDGTWIGINEKKEFAPASILKIPVMLTYFKLAESDPEILNQKLQYIPQDTEGIIAQIKQKSTAEIGKYYTVDELIKFLITESDNNADKILLDNLHPGTLEKTFRDFGIDLNNNAYANDFASLKICASFLRVLYNASYVNEALSEKGLSYLTKSKYQDGIVAGLPKDIVVAHKFGERYYSDSNKRELHEIAIIYYPNEPYILAIMTKGTDYKSLAKTIKNISALAYREIDAAFRASNKKNFISSE